MSVQGACAGRSCDDLDSPVDRPVVLEAEWHKGQDRRRDGHVVLGFLDDPCGSPTLDTIDDYSACASS